jgi:hypothetical protein
MGRSPSPVGTAGAVAVAAIAVTFFLDFLTLAGFTTGATVATFRGVTVAFGAAGATLILVALALGGFALGGETAAGGNEGGVGEGAGEGYALSVRATLFLRRAGAGFWGTARDTLVVGVELHETETPSAILDILVTKSETGATAPGRASRSGDLGLLRTTKSSSEAGPLESSEDPAILQTISSSDETSSSTGSERERDEIISNEYEEVVERLGEVSGWPGGDEAIS